MLRISDSLLKDLHYFLSSHGDKSFPGDSHITASDLYQRLQDEVIWSAQSEGEIDKNIVSVK